MKDKGCTLYALEWIVPGLPGIIDGYIVTSVSLVDIDVTLKMNQYQ
jgi:hypothetical protein